MDPSHLPRLSSVPVILSPRATQASSQYCVITKLCLVKNLCTCSSLCLQCSSFFPSFPINSTLFGSQGRPHFTRETFPKLPKSNSVS